MGRIYDKDPAPVVEHSLTSIAGSLVRKQLSEALAPGGRGIEIMPITGPTVKEKEEMAPETPPDPRLTLL